MTQTAIQLYTLRTLDESVPELLDRVGETELDGVEFAGRCDAAPTAIREALERNGLVAAGAHVPLDALDDSLDETLETYGQIGCDTLIVPGVDPEYFASAGGVDDLADRLSDLAATLEVLGARLLYHNHAFEFADIEGTAGYDRLVEATDDLVEFELDVGLATFAGADPVDLLSRHGDRIPLVHMTDTDTGAPEPRHAEFGSGDVELSACARAARHAGVDWLVYEHGGTADPEASLTEADAELPRLLGGR